MQKATSVVVMAVLLLLVVPPARCQQQKAAAPPPPVQCLQCGGHGGGGGALIPPPSVSVPVAQVAPEQVHHSAEPRRDECDDGGGYLRGRGRARIDVCERQRVGFHCGDAGVLPRELRSV